MRHIAHHTEYLFAAEATIHDVIEHQRLALKQELDAIGSEALLTRTLDEIIVEVEQKFRLDVPRLLRSEITQLPNEEIEVDVSQDPMRGIVDRSEPFFVKGTMVRIAIPFSGEPELFKYGQSQFNNPIPGEIQGDDLVLIYTAENLDRPVVQQDFDHRLSQIEAVLNMIRGPAEQWNGQLPKLIREQLEKRRAKVERDQTLNLGYPLGRAKKAPLAMALNDNRGTVQNYDLFLSHAHEDKDAIARPLYIALKKEGVSVWFDEAVLRIGDSLRRKIDEGLAKCRYGVVILSPRFLSKQWPQRELDGLVARETSSGEKAILPIWHELDRETLVRYSPPLADRLAGRSEDGIDSLVRMIRDVLSEGG